MQTRQFLVKGEMMEDIREALLSKVKSIRAWHNNPEDPLTAEDDTNDILTYLRSQGVAIKGEENKIYPGWFRFEPLVRE